MSKSATYRTRTKCISSSITTPQGVFKVPEVTKGKFYIVVDKNLHTMNSPDGMISILGDGGCQIERSRILFGNMLTD